MEKKSMGDRLLVLALAVFLGAGCGSNASGDHTHSRPGGEGARIEEDGATCTGQGQAADPVTGGRFACWFCSRCWQWEIPAAAGSLFVLLEADCDHAEGNAVLEVLRPDGSVIWERPIGAGEGGSFCVTDPNPERGLYSVVLHGNGSLGLIESFRGSVWIRAYTENGGFVESVPDTRNLSRRVP
ncbi:MAG: hypothetical protein AB1640_04165 [bacterium]